MHPLPVYNLVWSSKITISLSSKSYPATLSVWFGNSLLPLSQVAIPVYVRAMINFNDGQVGKVDITVGPKQTLGKTVRS